MWNHKIFALDQSFGLFLSFIAFLEEFYLELGVAWIDIYL